MATSYRITVTEEEYGAILSAAVAHEVHFQDNEDLPSVRREIEALDRVLAKLRQQREAAWPPGDQRRIRKQP